MGLSILSRLLIFFGLCWIVFYLIAYYAILSPDTQPSITTSQDGTSAESNKDMHKTHISINSRLLRESALKDPFLSDSCQTQTSTQTIDESASSVAVIITVRDDDPYDVISSIKSIVASSSPQLSNILLIDDWSQTPVTEWPHWHILDPKVKEAVKIYRTNEQLGMAGSKYFGSVQAQKIKSIEYLVFMSSPAIVSDHWLSSLIRTLREFPSSIVYPAVDAIATDGFVKGDNVLAAIDWSLNFVWESVDHRRIAVVPEHLEEISDNTPLSSPISSDILAMTVSFYNDIGGFDRIMNSLAWGGSHDTVELSLRVWLCGGRIIKQPCSRVAKKFSNFAKDAAIAKGATQRDFDRSALSIAERYMRPDVKGSPIDYKETVFQSRFLGRVPYSIELDQGYRYSEYMSGAKLSNDRCSSFEWFLKNVFPGLLDDRAAIAHSFNNHVKSASYLTSPLNPLISQYLKKHSDAKYVDSEIAKLAARANTPDEKAIQHHHDLLIPKRVPYEQPQDIIAKAAEIRLIKAKEAERQREEIERWNRLATANPTSAPVPEAIKTSKPSAAPLIKEKEDVVDIPPILPDEISEKEPEKNEVSDSVQANAAAVAAAESKPEVAPIVQMNAPKPPLEQNDAGIDVYTSQKQFAAGLLPDPGSNPSDVEVNCALNGKPNGEMMSRFILHNADDLKKAGGREYRIFCGIYTYEKNHDTNVKATRETWGKRCDGFLAMSTKSDPSIPSLQITHEGPEEYDNMWQKSRSIWKYIANRFVDDFDFFLLGGDDMFYILENLRYYLGTDPAITRSVDAGKGLFIGRRFFPPGSKVFNSGGAGYILDKAAVRVLGNHLDGPPCFPHQKGFWEDVNVANCLRETENIDPFDTRDMHERERFHPFQPGSHLTYRPPKPPAKDWYPDYNPSLKLGYECCSEDSISFHYAPANDLRSLFRYMYHCPKKEKTNYFGNVQ